MFKRDLQVTINAAVLTCVPLLIFINKITSLYFNSRLQSMPPFVGALTGLIFGVVLIFLSKQLNDLILKIFIKINYFNTEIEIPPAHYLLWKDNALDRTTKDNIRSKIQAIFGISFMDENGEEKNEALSRKEITRAIYQIKLLFRSNELFKQQNREYGFFLNLLAGCFGGCLFSFALILLGYYCNSEAVKNYGTISLTIYILPLLFRKFLVCQLINHYSKLFFKSFLYLDTEDVA